MNCHAAGPRPGPVQQTGPVPQEEHPTPLTKQDFEALARFRSGIRRYLRFSEETVRRHDLAPQQYQLLLALKGFPGRDWATVGELADRLQLRHHSTVELVNRAQGQDLVQRSPDPEDARVVRVGLSTHGERVIGQLSALHRDELDRMGAILTPPVWEDPEPSGNGHPGGVSERPTPGR